MGSTRAWALDCGKNGRKVRDRATADGSLAAVAMPTAARRGRCDRMLSEPSKWRGGFEPGLEATA